MQVTDEIWNDIERRLIGFPILNTAYLKIDGYHITMRLSRVKKSLTFQIFLIIDGEFNADWYSPTKTQHAEIQRRFLKKVLSHFSVIPMSLKNVKKYGKRFIKEFNTEHKSYYYEPFWPNFHSLKKHLFENNTSIELVQEPYTCDFLVDLPVLTGRPFA